jgi:hypothetical protein
MLNYNYIEKHNFLIVVFSRIKLFYKKYQKICIYVNVKIHSVNITNFTQKFIIIRYSFKIEYKIKV